MKWRREVVNVTYLEPNMHGRVFDAVVERVVDLDGVAVVEPESEQTQGVL